MWLNCVYIWVGNYFHTTLSHYTFHITLSHYSFNHMYIGFLSQQGGRGWRKVLASRFNVHGLWLTLTDSFTIKSYQIFPSDGHLAPFLLPRLLFQICSPGGTDLQFLNFIQWEVLFGKRNEKCCKSCFALRVVGEYIK